MQLQQDFKIFPKVKPEGLMHPAKTGKPRTPGLLVFFFVFFLNKAFCSFFWYTHTKDSKPAKCLIHDSNITVNNDERCH